MPTEISVNSFNAGELSPEVYGRVDLQQYQQGASSLKNMLVLPNGSARKRPGTKHLVTLTNTTEIAGFGRLLKIQTGGDTGQVILVTGPVIKSYSVAGAVGLNTVPPITMTEAIAKSIKSVQTKFDLVLVGDGLAPYRIYNNAGTITGPSAIPIQEPFLSLTFNIAVDSGKPKAIAALDERIVLANTDVNPNAIFGSAIKALDNFVNVVSWTTTSGTVSVSGETGVKVQVSDYLPSGYTSPSGTTLNTDMNFYASINVTDTAPYAFLILDNDYIEISWMTSTSTIQNGFLILGTPSGVYGVIGSGSSGAVIPGGVIQAFRLSASGCSDVQGLMMGNYLVFVDASKRNLRVAQFSAEADQFNTPRLNQLASHLFDSDIKEIHYQRTPYDTLWVLLENGKVLAFTYDLTGGLSAWTPMEFGGDATVESMTIIHTGAEDTVVFLVLRGTTYSIEKMMEVDEPEQKYKWFVDSGVIVENATAFNTVSSGLSHLEGKTVKIWADGGAHPDRVVTSGAITLNRSVNTAIIGLGYTSVVSTMPIAQAQDKIKRASRAFVRFFETIGAKAGDGEFEEIIPFMEGNFIMGAVPNPFTGTKEVPYSGRHDFDASITIFSDEPTPFHVLSIITRMEIYG